MTVVSPPSGAGAVAMTVSEPPSAMLRAAASACGRGLRGSVSSESMSTTASPPRAATGGAFSTACSTAWPSASAGAPSVSAAAGSIPAAAQSPSSSGRTPASTTDSSTSSWPFSAAASRRSASVLPARAAPAIVTREPLPNGVSHSIAFSVGSSEPSASRSAGKVAGRSSKRVPSATSSAGRPLIVSTRTSDGKRSERRGARTGPATVSPETSSQRLTCAAEM